MSNENVIASAIDQRDLLVAECRELLTVVANRPNCLKLLIGIRDQLLTFSQYKATRRKCG